MAGQAKPVRRFDVDGQPIRTGHSIGSLARTHPHSDERVTELTEHVEYQRGLSREEKDLTAEFREAEALAGIARPLEESENGLTAALLAMNDAAGERVAHAKLTDSERQARATASA